MGAHSEGRMNTDDFQLLYAAFAMAGLTFAVYWAMTIVGVVASAQGALSRDFVKTKAGAPPPAWVGNWGRNFVNLLEAPVLFYVVVALHVAFAPGAADGLQVILAWAFVGTRVAHTLVHVTINNVGLRFLTHRLGVLVLMVMWARFAMAAIAT